MSHYLVLYCSLCQGSRAPSEAWIAPPSGILTIFVDLSLVGIALSWGLTKVLVAQESSMAYLFIKLLNFLGFLAVVTKPAMKTDPWRWQLNSEISIVPT